MAATRALRAVSNGEAPRKRPTITEAASTGSRLALLEALRTRVAAATQDDKTPARDLAALSRRLMEIAREIETLKALEAEESAGEDSAGDDEAFDPSAV